MRTLTAYLVALAGFAEAPQFKVASVKVYAPGQFGLSNITPTAAGSGPDNVDMKQLIGYAYDVSPLVIAGDIPATCFEVEGKAEGAHTRGEIRLMLRASTFSQGFASLKVEHDSFLQARRS